MNEYAISIKNLWKKFDNNDVLIDVNIDISKGKIFGLLGPNGAGKTTIVRLVNGIIAPTAGEITILGTEVNSKNIFLHKKIGVLTENSNNYDNLSALDNLLFFGGLYGLSKVEANKRAEQLLEQLDLVAAKNKKVKSFSTGMKKRLCLARALIHNPEILFLDEPTNGLDPATSVIVNKLIADLSLNENKTIVICTHQLKYAEEICNEYAFINKGIILDSGDFLSLQKKYKKNLLLSLKLSSHKPISLANYNLKDDRIITEINSEEEVPLIVENLIKEQIKIYEVAIEKWTLEDLYFSVFNLNMGENLR